MVYSLKDYKYNSLFIRMRVQESEEPKLLYCENCKKYSKTLKLNIHLKNKNIFTYNPASSQNSFPIICIENKFCKKTSTRKMQGTQYLHLPSNFLKKLNDNQMTLK